MDRTNNFYGQIFGMSHLSLGSLIGNILSFVYHGHGSVLDRTDSWRLKMAYFNWFG
jgi:hypothetical protein